MLRKKHGEVHNYNGKKTKCIHLPTEWQELLWAAIALKKTKATGTANKKAQNSTQKKKAAPSHGKSRTQLNTPFSTQSTQSTSHIHHASPADDEDKDEDAEGNNNLELGSVLIFSTSTTTQGCCTHFLKVDLGRKGAAVN
ncbi:hypothetical protein DFH29DRAFT_871643 [Suillus ampliporus]|nr:hypothetical protein DFH29DRAFT_871643 [Suillus ampliporus]